jgi:branched-subunit amino acid ABC-type transport system permease component
MSMCCSPSRSRSAAGLRASAARSRSPWSGSIRPFAFTYLIYVLIVVSVGGLGSIAGSFAAAMVLGVSDIAGKYYMPAIGSVLIYLVMIVLLMWRPLGLFGRR